MRQRGFSLVELMVAIAILMMLILAAMPSIGTWLINTRIRNQADSIMSGLQTARAEAVRTNQNVSLWLVGSTTSPGSPDDTCALSATSASWVVSVTSPAGHCTGWLTTTPAKIVVSRSMGGNVGSVSVAATQSDGTIGTSVTFNGFGRVANSTSIAKIDLDGIGATTTYRKLSVMVSPTGSVRTCDPLVTSTTDPRHC